MNTPIARVRVLAVSDEVDEARATDSSALGAIELVIGCGDVPFEYLAQLMGELDAPLVFVPGNHDPDVEGFRQGRNGLLMRAGLPEEPPWPPGAVNADGRIVDVAGLRIAGLGGSLRYRDGPNQYTQRQQAKRARRLAAVARWRRFRDGRGVDMILAHAPPEGVGDGDDPVHRGFRAINDLVERLDPPLLLHGHVRLVGTAADLQLGRTVVRNVFGRRVFDIEADPAAHRRSASRRAS